MMHLPQMVICCFDSLKSSVRVGVAAHSACSLAHVILELQVEAHGSLLRKL